MSEIEELKVWVMDEVYESYDGYYAHILPIVPRVKVKPFNVVSYPLTTQSGRINKIIEKNIIQCLNLLNLDYRDFIDPFEHCVYTTPTKIGSDILVSKEYISSSEAIKYLFLRKKIRVLKI